MNGLSHSCSVTEIYGGFMSIINFILFFVYIGLKTIQLNDQKAGMQGLDKETINKIIYETSKGTPYFAFQEKRQKSIDLKINELQLEIKKITESQRKDAMEKV